MLKKLRNIKTVLSQIFEGYFKLIFKNKNTEKLYNYRKTMSNKFCHCSKYYINFGIFHFHIRIFEYCSECMCIKEAKFRCKDCECSKKNW